MENLEEQSKKGNELNIHTNLETESHLDQIKNELNLLKFQTQTLLLQNQILSSEKQKLEKVLSSYKNNPAIIGTVSEIFWEQLKAIVKTSNGLTFFVNIPREFISTIDIDKRVAMAQSNLAILAILPPEKDPRACAFEVNERPKQSMKDIGGLKEVIREIEETVILPMTKPHLFKKFNIESPKGILLYGPPGTGKTMLAKAIAAKTKSTFISLSGSELVHKYIGEGAKVVKDLFKIAKEKAPSIIFIDEIDSVAGYRMEITSGADREVNRTMTQLLVELDGFHETDRIKVIAATNRIDILDKALLRPGRFDRIIEIHLPNVEERKEIFKIYLNKIPHTKLDLDEIVKRTDNTNGAEIKLICKEAAIFAIRKNKEKVTMVEINEAIKKVLSKEKTKNEIINTYFR